MNEKRLTSYLKILTQLKEVLTQLKEVLILLITLDKLLDNYPG